MRPFERNVPVSAQSFYSGIQALKKYLDANYEYEIGDKKYRESPQHQKEFIQDCFAQAQNAIQEHQNEVKAGRAKPPLPRYLDMRKCICVESRAADRRKQAILSALQQPRVQSYREKYQEIDINKLYMDLQAYLLVSPNMLDKFSCLLLAAAVYISDYLFVTGQYQDLLYILDQYKVPEWEDFMILNKISTSKSTVQKILTLLYYRNVPGSIQQEVHNMHMLDNRAAERTLTYKGNPKETSEYREALNKILALIPDEDKESCESVFTEEALRFEASLIDAFAKKYTKLLNNLTKLRDEVYEAAKKVDGKSPKEIRQPPQLSILMPKDVLISAVDQVVRERFANIPTATDLMSLYNKTEAVSKEDRLLSDAMMYIGSPKYQMDKVSNGDINITVCLKETWDMVSDDFNPYDICFGYFLLLDKGEDIAWLFGTVNTVLSKAGDMLPWGRKLTWHWSDADIEEIILNENENVPESIAMYKLAYMDGEENLQQLLYRRTGLVINPRMFVSDDERKELTELGLSDDAATLFQVIKHLANDTYRMEAIQREMKQQQEELLKEEKPVEEPEPVIEEKPEETEEELRATIQKQREEIERLRKLAYGLKKDADAEKARADAAMGEKETQRKELADLREIVFRMKNDIEDEELTPEENNIKFPFETSGKITVFGGHDTWSKAIRPMLPSVRFIDKDTNPSEQLIRYSDVVWVQTNAMSHSMYNKIMSVTRMHNIPLRYFTSASAERCARQLAAENLKNS